MTYLISAAGLTGLFYCLATLNMILKHNSRSKGWWIVLVGTSILTGTVLRATIFLLCLFG